MTKKVNTPEVAAGCEFGYLNVECGPGTELQPQDLSPDDVGKMAARASVKTVVLTHLTAKADLVCGLKPLMIREGTAWRASLPAILGKTRRTE